MKSSDDTKGMYVYDLEYFLLLLIEMILFFEKTKINIKRDILIREKID
jgi:hypothetical protein